jgi:phenylacetate-CoA ligase
MTPGMDSSWQEWLEWQFGEVRKLIRAACYKSRFYRTRFETAGLNPKKIQSWDDFSNLVPLIDKETIIADQRNNPPFGSMLTTDPGRIKYIFCYAGPELIGYTENDWNKSITHGLPLALADIREDDVVNITMSFQWVQAGLSQFVAYNKRGATIIPGGIGDTATHIRMMQLTRTTVIAGFPTFIRHIAEKAKEMGLDPRTDLSIRLGMLSGEMYSRDQRFQLEEAFGMDTRQSYGTAEVGGVAYECALKNGMHIDPQVIVEVLDPANGQPVAQGHAGEIVITSLAKRCQPIIRFATKDITSGINFEPCGCGLNLPRLSNIIGRSGDILRVKGLWIVPRQIQEVLAGFSELGRFQAIVDRPGIQDVLTIKIQKTKPCDEANVVELLKRELKEKIRLSCEVELVQPEQIPEDAKIAIDKRAAV